MPGVLSAGLRRRRLLDLAARGGLLLPTAFLPACDDTPPRPAVAPWRGPPAGLAEPALAALSWAVLAPSPLNTQPWLVEHRPPDRLALRLDPQRLLPAGDPRARQAVIALGAFLELLALAMAARGHDAGIELAASAELAAVARGARPLARIGLRPDAGAGPDPLLAALPWRRSSRQAFDPEKPLKAGDEPRLRAAVTGLDVRLGIVREHVAVAALRARCEAAFLAAQARKDVLAEQAAWLRLDPAELARRPDGLPLTGAAIWCLRQVRLLTAADLADPDGLAALLRRLVWHNLFLGTASFGWLATRGDGLPERILAGRAYQRLDLACAAAGVAIHPVSEAVEAMTAPADLTDLAPPWRIQMLFRLGYAGPMPPTPRREVAAILHEAS